MQVSPNLLASPFWQVDPDMFFAGQWVEPGHRHRAEEQQRAQRSDRSEWIARQGLRERILKMDKAKVSIQEQGTFSHGILHSTVI